LLGYDFTIEYKKEVNNPIADALSRRTAWNDEVTMSLLSIPTANWVNELKSQYQADEDL
jgi:hypothetical protein